MHHNPSPVALMQPTVGHLRMAPNKPSQARSQITLLIIYGNYTVTLTVTDSLGTSSSTVLIRVNGAQPTATPAVTRNAR